MMELTSRACRSTSAASVSVIWNQLLTFNRIMVASECQYPRSKMRWSRPVSALLCKVLRDLVAVTFNLIFAVCEGHSTGIQSKNRLKRSRPKKSVIRVP